MSLDITDDLKQELKNLIPLPDEELKSMIQHFFSFDNEVELKIYLKELLGTSLQSEHFIGLICDKKFKKSLPSSKLSRSNNTSQSKDDAIKSHFKHSGNVIFKKGQNDADDYFIKVTKPKQKQKSKQASAPTPPSGTEPESDGEPKAQLSNNMMKKINADRTRCDCYATKHDLLANCVACGRIMCKAEGPGHCFFCGNLVVDYDTPQCPSLSDDVASETYQPRGDAILTVGQWKLTRDPEADEARAVANLEKLLLFDITSAKRSKVIDQASDFKAPDAATLARETKWLSQEEKLLEKTKLEAKLKQLDVTRSGTKVISIDLRTKRVTIDPTAGSDNDEPSSSEPKSQSLKASTRSNNFQFDKMVPKRGQAKPPKYQKTKKGNDEDDEIQDAMDEYDRKRAEMRVPDFD